MIKTRIIPFFLTTVFLLIAGVETTSAKEQNLAKYRVVYQSSSIDQSQSGHLAVDGSNKTYWESKDGNDNDWIKIDLGAVYPIDKIVIHWGENYGTDYQVSSSKINESGEVILAQKQNAKGGVETIMCPNTKGQIIKIEINKVNDIDRGCVITEVEVYGQSDEERFVPSSVTPISANNLTLNGNSWRIQNTMFVNDTPQEISKPAFNDQEWIPAKVPGTVLGSYVDFGALPDPYFADNMHEISEKFFSGNNFWYRTSFSLPQTINGKRLFLNFDGINWKAEIYINGQYLGRIDGAFLRKDFEITKMINKNETNTVAVLIYHPDNWVTGPYNVKKKSLGGRTTNGDMHGLDSPAYLATAGWNWIPITRGRDIGIWNNVTFKTQDDVSIKDPWVSSVILLPDTTKADLTIHAELKNSSSEPVKGKLIAKFAKTTIEYPVTLNANEYKTISIDKTKYPELAIKNPKLWWPNGYGEQNLYKLSLQFVQDNQVSDETEINFGIRKLDFKVNDNILFFYCNGVRISLKGGNWGMPDMMLNCDSLFYDVRVKLHKEANLNIIRNWVGLTGHEWFYDACDRYGILIWDDFWLANPGDGPDPKDTAMFMSNAIDKIKWVRKHPALALYCGRNEGLPPLELDNAMKHQTQVLDGTRYYIPRSDAGTVTGHGPYDVREPIWYFKNRGVTLHSELGIVTFPEVESMRRMMLEKDLWPINNMWAIHDYQWGRSEKFTARIESRYGITSGVEDYCNKAQLLNYESTKAMFECLQSNQGSGIILWMSQSAWPSMICQLYDYYLEYTSSYFAAKNASEPIHVFWDISKNKIGVANNTTKSLTGLNVKATLYSLSGSIIWEKSGLADVKPNSAVISIDPGTIKANQVRFLKLELMKNGKMISENFYWVETPSENCTDLNDLPKVDLTVKATKTILNGAYKVTVNLNNPTSSISLLTKIKVKNAKTGASILPVFFSDDYVSLLPGENKVITLEFKTTGNDSPELWIEGWNALSKKIDL